MRWKSDPNPSSMPVDNRACDRLNGFMDAVFLHLGQRADEQRNGPV